MARCPCTERRQRPLSIPRQDLTGKVGFATVSKLSYINNVTGKETRIHLRVQADPSAPVRVDIMGHGFLDVLNARDISVGGLGIRVPHGFVGCDIDGEVDLIVTLGRAAPFKTTGSIRHHGKVAHDQLFGVEFTSLSPKQLEAVEAYIHSCLRRGSRQAMNAVRVLARG